MSFSCCLSPHRCIQSEVLNLHFPTLEPWVAWSVLLPSCFSWFIHMQMWDHPVQQLSPRPVCQLPPPPCPPCPPGTAFLWVFSAQLPVSAAPTSLDEWFFFNSLVVRPPYSSIFCQFWLFFVFKFVVLLLVVRGGTVYLPMPTYWLEVSLKFSSLQFLYF